MTQETSPFAIPEIVDSEEPYDLTTASYVDAYTKAVSLRESIDESAFRLPHNTDRTVRIIAPKAEPYFLRTVPLAFYRQLDGRH